MTTRITHNYILLLLSAGIATSGRSVGHRACVFSVRLRSMPRCSPLRSTSTHRVPTSRLWLQTGSQAWGRAVLGDRASVGLALWHRFASAALPRHVDRPRYLPRTPIVFVAICELRSCALSSGNAGRPRCLAAASWRLRRHSYSPPSERANVGVMLLEPVSVPCVGEGARRRMLESCDA